MKHRRTIRRFYQPVFSKCKTAGDLFREALFFQPARAFSYPWVPFGRIIFLAPKAHAVFAVLIHVQFEGHTRFAHRGGESS